MRWDVGVSLGEPVDHIVYRHPKLNNRPLETLEAASSLTDDGYIIEARIPLNDLRGPTPVEDSSKIGFNISTCDADEGGATWHHLLWQGTDEWDARQWAEGTLGER